MNRYVALHNGAVIVVETESSRKAREIAAQFWSDLTNRTVDTGSVLVYELESVSVIREKVKRITAWEKCGHITSAVVTA